MYSCLLEINNKLLTIGGESYSQRGELEQVHPAGQPDRHPLRVGVGPLPGRQHLPRLQGGHAGRRHRDLQRDLWDSVLAGIPTCLLPQVLKRVGVHF